MSRTVRVLSLDGGGVRGVIPGQVLVALEEKLGGCVADHFDLIAGTSTGGILACLLLCPDESGGARFTAFEAVDLYREHGRRIFDRSLLHRVRTGWGARDERYPSDNLEDALEDYFGDLWLSELLRPCLITSYDIRNRRAVFFTQHNAASRRSKDFRVRDVARATSAAPTYFEVALIRSRDREPFPLVDGGVFANNPAMCAYAEVRSGYSRTQRLDPAPTASDIVMLSLGTGRVRKAYSYRSAKSWGLLQWARPLIDILMSAGSETVDYQLRQIFGAVDARDRYLRIDPTLEPGQVRSELDDASPGNLVRLAELGRCAADVHDEELDRFAELLKSCGGERAA